MKIIEILLNDCHGGFGFSDLAKDEYNKIKLQKDINYKIQENIDYYSLSIRTDLDMIEIVKKLGDKANSRYAKIYIKKINHELLDCIIIEEYDGIEWVSFKTHKYKIDKINNIIKEDISADLKIKKIEDIIKLKIECVP